jgi:hypothetical protein
MSDKYPGGFVTANAPAGFSVAFDGTANSYLTAPDNTAFDLGSGDFVVECWVYLTASTDYGVLLGQWGIPRGYAIRQRAGKLAFVYSTNGSNETELSSTTSYALNTWYYVAAVRTSNTLGLFINSTREASASMSGVTINNSTDIFSVGRAGNAADYTTGYISNARVIKGTVPTEYSATATSMNTPTQLFPVTNTSILTCQSPTIIDNSTNAFTITAGSGAKVSNFTPFAAYQGFNPALGAAAGGVWTLDEAAYYQNNRQWPIYDPYFKNTTLMLHGNGTNAAQNNTFLDSSTNNFTITRNGNTTQGSFTPFSQTGWSTFFNGSTDYLLGGTNAAYTFGTGDLTIEMWMWATTTTGGQGLIGFGGAVPGVATLFINAASGTANIRFNASSGTSVTTGNNAWSPNQWNHIAVSRASGVTRIFVNGALQVSASQTDNLGGADVSIGRAYYNLNQEYFSGYLSNIRVIKGTALYTGNFTPSTQPLNVVTNTVLLTCQDNRFVDDSANNFAITANGSPSVQAFSPFVPAYITPTTYSNWFNGSSGYLSRAFTSTTDGMYPQGTTWTLEMWVYMTGTSGDRYIYVCNAADAASFGYITLATSSGVPQIAFRPSTGGSLVQVLGGTVAANTWTHLAASASGGTLRLFVNGVSVGTPATITSSTFTPTGVGIGYFQNGYTAGVTYFSGCISNLRLTQGGALYTAAFTPPTAPLTTTVSAGTVSLLTCQSSTFIDNSTNNFTITANGNVQPVTSPTPFPANVDTTTLNSAYSTSLIGGSGYFDGSGDYINSSITAFGTGNFTIQCWVYFTAAIASKGVFHVATATALPGSVSGVALANGSSGGWALYYNNGSQNTTATLTPALNTWVHLAVVRTGTTIRVYVNGVMNQSQTDSANYTNQTAAIGGFFSTSNLMTGYISGFKVTNTADYSGTSTTTANFTLPTAPPSPTSSILCCNFTNAGIYDSTAKNVLETVGNAQISTTQSKWGGSSMYFDGTGDCLFMPSTATTRFGAANWTIEFWFRTTAATTRQVMLCWNAIATNYGACNINFLANGKIGLQISETGSSWKFDDTSTGLGSALSANTWYYLAVTRSGATVTVYIDGSSIGTYTLTSATSSLMTNDTRNVVGSSADLTNQPFNGYIDDLRVTQGVARYITNFTPPTSQLQDQ